MVAHARRAHVSVALAASVLLVACHRSSNPPPSPGSAGRGELGSAPLRRIVPANAAAAEFLAALLGDRGPERVVALPEQVDGYSCFDFEKGAWAVLPRFPRYTAEALIVLEPDLVLTHAWQSAETTSVLRSRGVMVIVLDSAEGKGIDGIRGSLEMLARRLGVVSEGAEVLAALGAREAKLRETAGTRSKLRALVYSNDGTGGWAAGAATTADAMVRLAGLRDAAAEAGLEGHVPLDFEKLLGLDPDVIVVGEPAEGEGGSPTKSVLESAKELAGLSAVVSRRIVTLPAPLLSVDSPFLMDAAERLAAQVDALLARGGSTSPR